MNTAMKWTFVFVTPELAQEWLEVNAPHNRKPSQMWIDTLAQSMSDGTYVTTHQGVAFDSNQELCDGQHRLLAIMKSGVSVPLWVCEGVPAEAFRGIDIGRKRSMDIVLNKDRRHTDLINALLCMLSAAKFRTAEYVAAGLEAFGSNMDDFHSVIGMKSSRKGVTANIRAMGLLRFATAKNQSDRDYVVQQVKALLAKDYEAMSNPVRRFSVAIDNALIKGIRMDATGGALRAWASFDPIRGDLTTAFVRDKDFALSEIKIALKQVWADAPIFAVNEKLAEAAIKLQQEKMYRRTVRDRAALSNHSFNTED